MYSQEEIYRLQEEIHRTLDEAKAANEKAKKARRFAEWILVFVLVAISAQLIILLLIRNL